MPLLARGPLKTGDAQVSVRRTVKPLGVQPVVTSTDRRRIIQSPATPSRSWRASGGAYPARGVGDAGAAVGDVAHHACRSQPQRHLDRWPAVAQAVGGNSMDGQDGVLGRLSAHRAASSLARSQRRSSGSSPGWARVRVLAPPAGGSSGRRRPLSSRPARPAPPRRRTRRPAVRPAVGRHRWSTRKVWKVMSSASVA